MDEEKELQDSPNPDEESIDSEEKNSENLDNPEEDKYEEESKEGVSREDHNKEVSRRKRAEALIEKMKSEKRSREDKQEKPPVEDKADKPVAKELNVREVLELKGKGYTEGEILRIDNYARKYGVPYQELLEDELFKAGMEARRKEDRVEQATPASTNRSITINKKSFKDMSEDERRKNFGAVVDKIKNRKR